MGVDINDNIMYNSIIKRKAPRMRLERITHDGYCSFAEK